MTKKNFIVVAPGQNQPDTCERDTKGLIALGTAIIKQAIEDLTNPFVESYFRGYMRARQSARLTLTARMFLRKGNPEFEFWCSVLGVNSQEFLDKLVALGKVSEGFLLGPEREVN